MPSDGDYRDFPLVGAARLGDLQALQHFAEHYDYDPVGNFASLVHRAEHGSWTRHYAYHEPSLLEPEQHSNRLSQTHLRGDEDRGPERYLYDANGNMVQMPHLPGMQWDFTDRLAASARQVVNGGEPETTFYQYDAAGERVRKVTERRDGTRRNERLYIGGYEVFREYDGHGDAVALERETLHVMDDKERIALVETLTRDHGHSLHAAEPVKRYQLANHLGSATLELDEASRLISYEEYAPYGETVYQAGRHAAEVRRKRYRHTGKERDDETGLGYHGARYYAPWLGRWTSTDPMGIAKSPDLYLYARCRPTRLVDPSGRTPKDPEIAAGEAKLHQNEKELVRLRGQQANLVKGEESAIERLADAKFFLEDMVEKNIGGIRGQRRHVAQLTDELGNIVKELSDVNEQVYQLEKQIEDQRIHITALTEVEAIVDPEAPLQRRFEKLERGAPENSGGSSGGEGGTGGAEGGGTGEVPPGLGGGGGAGGGRGGAKAGPSQRWQGKTPPVGETAASLVSILFGALQVRNGRNRVRAPLPRWGRLPADCFRSRAV